MKQHGLLGWIEYILSLFEKERFGILTLFIWVIVLGGFRMWVEAYLFNYPYAEISYDFIFYHAHIVSFYVAAFVGGVTILKIITKEKLAKIANVSAIGFIMVILPPFLDILTSVNPEPYSYVSPFNLLETLQPFSGTGIFFEAIGILAATSLYVFIKLYRKGIGKAIGFSVLNWLLFMIFIVIHGSPFIPEFTKNAGPLEQPLMLVRHILLTIILLIILLYFTNKKLFKSFLKSSRLLSTSHFVLMTIIGIFIAGNLQSYQNIQLDVFGIFSDPLYLQIFTGNIAMFFLSLLIVFFGWQYTLMINHVYDDVIDKTNNTSRVLPQNLLSKRQVRQLAFVYAIISGGLAILIGLPTFIIVLIGLFFGTIYSVPPIRIRDSIFSTTIIGIGSLISFFIGYLTPSYIRLMHGENAGSYVRIYPEISENSLIIGLLIFIALSIGPLIKDYKDYEGDKKAGVKNIFTIYGKEKGIKITSVLLPIPFICLLVLFQTIVDIIIILPLSIMVGIIFYRYRKTILVFAIYFPLIFYCLLRWFEFILL